MANEIEQTRGQVSSLILRTLLEQDRYGLEIFNEIKNLDNMIGTIKQPTFYNALKRLENAGLLSSYSGGVSNGAKRVYYSITNKGRAYLQDEYTQWQLDDGSLKDYFTDDDYFDDEEPVKRHRRTRRASSNSEEIAETNISSVAFSTDAASVSIKSDSNDGVRVQNNDYNNSGYNNSVSNLDRPSVIRKFTYEYESDSNAKTLAEKQRILDELINTSVTTTDSVNENHYNSDNSEDSHDNIEYDSIESSLTETNVEKAIEKQCEFNENTCLGVNLNNHPLPSQQPNTTVDDMTNNKLITESVSDAPSPAFKEFNTSGVNYGGNVKPEKINKVNYIDSLNDIYNSKPIDASNLTDNTRANNVTTSAPLYYDDYDEEKIKETSFNKLKQKFALENIKLKQYVRSNTPGFYIGRYYYSAKLLRDTSFIIYALYFAFCLIAHFVASAKGVSVSVPGLVTSLLVGVLLPISVAIYYALLPSRRKYANFNFSLALISAFILLIVSIVIIVMSAFFGFKVNVADSRTLILPLIIPISATLLLPLSVVLYGILYNSKRYHLK